MRKALLEQVSDIIRLEELVACTLDVTAEQMWWKKYYYVLNGKTKKVTTKTKTQWCELLNVDIQQLEKAIENQQKDIIL